jgi:hypothetical protein
VQLDRLRPHSQCDVARHVGERQLPPGCCGNGAGAWSFGCSGRWRSAREPGWLALDRLANARCWPLWPRTWGGRIVAGAHAYTSEPARLVRRSGGYLLEVDRDHVDAHRFRALVEQARKHECSGQPAQGALARSARPVVLPTSWRSAGRVGRADTRQVATVPVHVLPGFASSTASRRRWRGPGLACDWATLVVGRPSEVEAGGGVERLVADAAATLPEMGAG